MAFDKSALARKFETELAILFQEKYFLAIVGMENHESPTFPPS